MIVSITEDGRKYFSDNSIVPNTKSSTTSLFILDWTFSTDPSQYYQEYKTSFNGRDYTIVGYFSYDQKIKLIDSVDVFNARYEKIASIVDVFRPVGAKPVDIGNDQFYLSPADERLVDGGGDDYADLGDGNDVFYYVSGRDKVYGGAGLDMVEAAGFSHPSLSVAAAGDDWYDVRSGARLLFSTKYVELIAFGGFAARIEGDKVRFETAPELVSSIAAKAAIATAAVFTGLTPSQARFDELVSFGETQYRAYAETGVANPSLGPFEAFGKAYAADVATKSIFASRFGSLGEQAFLDLAYETVFAVKPEAAASAALSAQIAYFGKLYRDVGISGADAALQARGAVLGQIVGYAFTDPVAGARSSLDETVGLVAVAGTSGDYHAFGHPLMG